MASHSTKHPLSGFQVQPTPIENGLGLGSVKSGESVFFRWNDLNPLSVFTIIALYTPVLQALALYFFLYRGDLLRFRHPLREKRGLRAWLGVLTQLGLINEKIEVSGGRRRMVAARLVGRLLMPTAMLSLLSAYLLAPLLLETISLLARFESLLLFFIQLIPSTYFLLLAERDYLGPLPVGSERCILPPKHRSSLIRHLEEL